MFTHLSKLNYVLDLVLSLALLRSRLLVACAVSFTFHFPSRWASEDDGSLGSDSEFISVLTVRILCALHDIECIPLILL